MSEERSYFAEINGTRSRIWEKGSGTSLYWLPSHVLALKWSPFHEELASRFRLVCCSLPGYAGGTGHDGIDSHLDWCLAGRDLLSAAGFREGDTLMGSSVGGALATDLAAMWPDLVGRLILVAPLGISDPVEPTRDLFAVMSRDAPGVFCSKPEAYARQVAPPEGEDPGPWSILVNRGLETSARLLWPLNDTGVATRLHRITSSTLLVWGAEDAVVPPSYAKRFASGLSGPTSVVTIPGAGHNVELDEPETLVAAIFKWIVP